MKSMIVSVAIAINLTACGGASNEGPTSELDASGPRRICKAPNGEIALRVLGEIDGNPVLTEANPAILIQDDDQLRLLGRILKMELDGSMRHFHEVEFNYLRGWVDGSYLCNIPNTFNGVSGVARLSESQVRDILNQAGIFGRHENFLTCVAKYETNYTTGIDNRGLNRDGTIDVGLFQINNAYWPRDTSPRGTCATFETLKYDPLENAKCAWTVLNAAPHYAKHWATYEDCAGHLGR